MIHLRKPITHWTDMFGIIIYYHFTKDNIEYNHYLKGKLR